MRFLKKNIFVTAPSDSIKTIGDRLRLENAVKNFKDRGIEVVLGDTVNIINKYDTKEYKLKAKELQEALLNDDIDIVISANGGDSATNILEYIDFNKLKENKEKEKIYQGFSDNTVITFLLTILSDWKSFYSPCFPTFGYNNWDETIQDNFKLLKGENIIQKSQEKYERKSFKKVPGKELDGYNLDTENNIFELNNIKEFETKGIFLGGCLDILKNIVGTKYDKVKEYNEKHENIIWYIENCIMDIQTLKETLETMIKNEWFKNVKAFMIGKGKITLDEEFLEKQNNLLKEILSKYNVPIIINADFGHVRPYNTIINGAEGILRYKEKIYTIEYLDIFK